MKIRYSSAFWQRLNLNESEENSKKRIGDGKCEGGSDVRNKKRLGTFCLFVKFRTYKIKFDFVL